MLGVPHLPLASCLALDVWELLVEGEGDQFRRVSWRHCPGVFPSRPSQQELGPLSMRSTRASFL